MNTDVTRRSESEGARSSWPQLLPLYVVAGCVLALTIVLLRRDVGGGRPPGTTFEQAEHFDALLSRGHWDGSPDAPVRIVVFSDMQCPACRRLALQYVPEAKQRFGDRIAFLHRHWPLDNHRFAFDAARAVECAASQGRFQSMFDETLLRQNELGVVPYATLAEGVGVPDVPAFTRCVESKEPDAVIEQDRDAVARLESFGTPTVIVNGWYAKAGFSPVAIDSLIQDLLDGRSPAGRQR